VTLHYFSVRARGEPIRMLMRYADIPFTNEYVAVESWMGLKEKGVYAKAPGATHATLPVLFLEENGQQIPDSLAIAEWIAKEAPSKQLMGADPDRTRFLWLSLDAEEAPWGGNGRATLGVINPLLNFFPMSDSLQKIPGFLSSLKRVLSWWSDEVKRTEGDFLGGAAPSIADFKIFHTLNNISTLFGEAYFNKAVTQSLRAWYASMAPAPSGLLPEGAPPSGLGPSGHAGQLHPPRQPQRASCHEGRPQRSRCLGPGQPSV